MFQAMESLIGTLSTNQSTLQKLVEIIYREKEDTEAKREKERQSEHRSKPPNEAALAAVAEQEQETEKQDADKMAEEAPPPLVNS